MFSIEILVEEFKPVALESDELKSDIIRKLIGPFRLFGLQRFKNRVQNRRLIKAIVMRN